LPNPLMTIAICTRNRSGFLKKALEGLRAQTADMADAVVMVVNNGSTDDTEYTAKSYETLFPHFIYLDEPVTGLSTARNTALRACTTPYIVYLDDDAVPVPDWLSGYREAIEQYPQAVAMAGRVRIDWALPRPEWLADSLLSYLGYIDYGAEMRPIGRDEPAFGCNMLFRTEALKGVGGFHPHLGLQGNTPIAGEENLVQWALLKAGGEILYVPKAIIDHYAGTEKLNKEWFDRRLFFAGVSDIRLWRIWEKPGMSQQLKKFFKNFWWVMRKGWRNTDYATHLKVHVRLGRLYGLITR
jgi:glucosyl-dolichyl phosphate glucuronosyltransferase